MMTKTTTAQCTVMQSERTRCPRPATNGTLCWYHDPVLAAERERTSKERHAAERAVSDAVVAERAALKTAGDAVVAYLEAQHETPLHTIMLDAARELRTARETLTAARRTLGTAQDAAEFARLRRS